MKLKYFKNILKDKRKEKNKKCLYLQLISSFNWRFSQSHLLLLGASWHKNETMWSDICLIIPEFVLVLVRGWIVWTAHTMYPVTSIMSLNGGSSWPRGDWSWDSWLVGLPGAGARCFSCVCVCACTLHPTPNSSLIIYIVSDAGLKAQRRIWSCSHWPCKRDVFPIPLSDRQT